MLDEDAAAWCIWATIQSIDRSLRAAASVRASQRVWAPWEYPRM